jgi:predicted branched-subunit amino acid permease
VKFKLLHDLDFRDGVKDGIPICIAFIFMGMSYAGLAKINGFSLLQTLAMGIMVYAIPLQIIILQLFKTGLNLITVVFITFIVNFRFSLMSLSLLPYFKNHTLNKLIPAFSILAASSFTVAHVKFSSQTVKNPFYYYLGAGLAVYITNFFAMLLGFYLVIVSANVELKQIFTIALAIHFTALTAMRWPKIKLIIATALGFILMPLFSFIVKDELSIILVPICVSLIVLVTSKFMVAK